MRYGACGNIVNVKLKVDLKCFNEIEKIQFKGIVHPKSKITLLSFQMRMTFFRRTQKMLFRRKNVGNQTHLLQLYRHNTRISEFPILGELSLQQINNFFGVFFIFCIKWFSDNLIVNLLWTLK